MAAMWNTLKDICTAHVHTLSWNTDQFCSSYLDTRHMTYRTLTIEIYPVWQLQNLKWRQDNGMCHGEKYDIRVPRLLHGDRCQDVSQRDIYHFICVRIRPICCVGGCWNISYPSKTHFNLNLPKSCFVIRYFSANGSNNRFDIWHSNDVVLYTKFQTIGTLKWMLWKRSYFGGCKYKYESLVQ